MSAYGRFFSSLVNILSPFLWVIILFSFEGIFKLKLVTDDGIQIRAPKTAAYYISPIEIGVLCEDKTHP